MNISMVRISRARYYLRSLYIIKFCFFQLDTQNTRRSQNTSNADINNISMESSAESQTSKQSRKNNVSMEASASTSTSPPPSKRPRRS